MTNWRFPQEKRNKQKVYSYLILEDSVSITDLDSGDQDIELGDLEEGNNIVIRGVSIDYEDHIPLATVGRVLYAHRPNDLPYTSITGNRSNITLTAQMGQCLV